MLWYYYSHDGSVIGECKNKREREGEIEWERKWMRRWSQCSVHHSQGSRHTFIHKLKMFSEWMGIPACSHWAQWIWRRVAKKKIFTFFICLFIGADGVCSTSTWNGNECERTKQNPIQNRRERCFWKYSCIQHNMPLRQHKVKWMNFFSFHSINIRLPYLLLDTDDDPFNRYAILRAPWANRIYENVNGTRRRRRRWRQQHRHSAHLTHRKKWRRKTLTHTHTFSQ